MKEILKQEAIELLANLHIYEQMHQAEDEKKKEMIIHIIDIISAPYRTCDNENSSFTYAFLQLKKAQISIHSAEIISLINNCGSDREILYKIIEFLSDMYSKRLEYSKNSRSYYQSELRPFLWAVNNLL